MSAKPIIQSGRVFTPEEIEYVQQMVSRFNLPRYELAETLCEHWNWFTASGGCKSHACLALLKQLEDKGLQATCIKEHCEEGKDTAANSTNRTEVNTGV